MTLANKKITHPQVWLQAGYMVALSALLCLVYAAASTYFFGVTPTPLEFLGTLGSLACVLLVRYQNILNWPIGIIGSLLMGIFFWQIDVVGQAGLQLLFFVPIQFWCWYNWIDKTNAQRVQIPITPLGKTGWVTVGSLYLLGTILAASLISTYDAAVFATWDGSIVAASMIAQFLLAYKKPASWTLWLIPVNVASIGLFIATGAYMFAALYVIFLINALFALIEWLREVPQTKMVTAAAHD